MPDRLEIADLTAPALTPVNAPVEIALPWDGGIVRRVTIVIPDGHAGLTGLALGYAHTPVIPRRQPSFVSGNDEVFSITVKDAVPGVPWAAFVVNLDTAPHVFEVRFELDEVSALTPLVTRTAIPADAIETSAADLADQGVTASADTSGT